MAKTLTYSEAGVSINANDEMVELISANVRSTHSPRVMHLPNGFAGLFRLDYDEKLFKKNYRNPVLVACTDGVGTKVKVASLMNKFDTVGIDLVAMSVNDMLVQGAEPLFFLDYIAVNHLEPPQINEFVAGISKGCRLAECALIGGETAEMPDVYRPGEFDLAGFAVGVVEKNRIVTGDHVEVGDSVIGLASHGLHSNGYSLVRRICFDRQNLKISDHVEQLGETLGEALLRPTRIYTRAIMGLLKKYKVKKVVKAMAHITGGGLVGNIPRVINNDLDVVLHKKWPVPPIFDYLQQLGPVETDEMYRVFNMGIGYILVVAPSFTRSILSHLRKLGEKPYFLGKVKRGSGKVIINDTDKK
ncbi:MAG: phosphoribosylformylglycinamidine cyclo-ligase [Sedimentisphaerales bacterium]|nr:phosphoribosylformylglycinamidine cyclo-ligase [Sedimentisphaerales bacterium]